MTALINVHAWFRLALFCILACTALAGIAALIGRHVAHRQARAREERMRRAVEAARSGGCGAKDRVRDI